jgi:hypothetical protein
MHKTEKIANLFFQNGDQKRHKKVILTLTPANGIYFFFVLSRLSNEVVGSNPQKQLIRFWRLR